MNTAISNSPNFGTIKTGTRFFESLKTLPNKQQTKILNSLRKFDKKYLAKNGDTLEVNCGQFFGHLSVLNGQTNNKTVKQFSPQDADFIGRFYNSNDKNVHTFKIELKRVGEYAETFKEFLKKLPKEYKKINSVDNL